MTDKATAAALALPAAARMQNGVTMSDLEMTEAARVRHPAVRWWWGQRVTGGRNGAVCYLCDAFIASWYRARPITGEAIEAILVHADLHLIGVALSPGTSAPTIPAGAVASTERGHS